MSTKPQPALCTVQFEPGGRSIGVCEGTPLSETAARAHVVVDYPCGGQGNCGKCQVRVVGDAGTVSLSEHVHLGHDALERGMRLACQAAVRSDLIVSVPERDVAAGEYKILTHAELPARSFDDPVLEVRPYSAPPPTMLDDRSDAARVGGEIGPFEADMTVLRSIRGAFSRGEYHGTAIRSGAHLLEVYAGEGYPECYGAAFDIGTTTLVSRLICLRTGAGLACASRLNPQVGFGSDVLTRIGYASRNAEALQELHACLLVAVHEMIEEMALVAEIDPEMIFAVTFAGNTVMQHFLCGLDPGPIGRAPFVPATCEPIELSAAAMGIRVHPRARCYVFPVIAGYVGGDILSGLVATRFAEGRSAALFVDIGTNGEMVIRANGRLLATSCAAGPAFEGAGITQGMRATSGAVEHVRLDEEIYFTTIGGDAPIGFCGSGLIDLTAELLRLGLLSESGGFQVERAGRCPSHIARRVHDEDGRRGFYLVESSENQSGRPVALFERDVAELRLATAAIRSGIEILLRRAGIRYDDLEQVVVAGAFGNYIHCENAQMIGVLPTSIDPARIEFVGNTSLEGARQALLSRGVRTEAIRLAQSIEHVDLSLDAAFHDTFVDALLFPSTLGQTNV